MRGKKQRLKILYISKRMKEQTDVTHFLAMSQIKADIAYDIDP